jgi:hypothetical protein
VKERALSILAAIQQNKPLLPVFVDQPSGLKSPYKFRLYDGFHRYHLCKTLCFTHLWAYINSSNESLDGYDRFSPTGEFLSFA